MYVCITFCAHASFARSASCGVCMYMFMYVCTRVSRISYHCGIANHLSGKGRAFFLASTFHIA